MKQLGLTTNKMTRCLFPLVFWLASSQAAAVSPKTATIEKADQNRQKLEDLFIWKVSDSLGLNSKEEIELKKLLTRYRDEKQKRNEEIHDLVKKLGVGAGSSTELLQNYKDALKRSNDLQIEEVDAVQKTIGIEKTAKFLVLRDQLINKLKEALSDASSRDKGLKTKVKEPKIIQEQ